MPAAMRAPSEAHDQPGYRREPEAGAPNVRPILKNDMTGVDTSQLPKHPLPWRNTPSGGENHVTDANGLRVYDGLDGAEVFRLYAEAAQAAALHDTSRARRRNSGIARESRVGLVGRLHRLLHRR